MDISELDPGTSKFERTLFLNNETESHFIAWLNNFVMISQFFAAIDEQYIFFIVDPKKSPVVTFPAPLEGFVSKSGENRIVAWPQPIGEGGRPPYKFPWVLLGCLSKNNADGSVSVGVKTIEAVTIKSFQVADRVQVTISTDYKLVEDLYWPALREAIEKAYPGSTLTKAEQADTEPKPQEETKPKSKRGRSSFTKQEKIDTRKEWENLDPDLSTETLEGFLERKFGANPDGSLIVAESTFYSWPKK